MKPAKSQGKGRKTPDVTTKKQVVPTSQAPRSAAGTIAPMEPLKKDKLVRDSFTLPQEDFALIAALKDRALDFKRPTKKSELLRAGLQVLAKLDQAALRATLEALRPLKAGRPKKKS